MHGLFRMGSISLGTALVAGNMRVPNPAAGITALRTFNRNTFSDVMDCQFQFHFSILHLQGAFCKIQATPRPR
jgi:hypothetical protein